MERGEDFEDRNREAPVTSYDMGLYDYDIIPDPYSPKFQRERAYSEKGLQVNNDKEKKQRRHHCHHHRLHSRENTKSALSTTESEPNIRRVTEVSTESLIVEKVDGEQEFVLYVICGVLGLLIVLLTLTMIHYYGQELDRLFSCDRTRYNAVAYNERGLMYYVCKALKNIRNPGITFLEH